MSRSVVAARVFVLCLAVAAGGVAGCESAAGGAGNDTAGADVGSADATNPGTCTPDCAGRTCGFDPLCGQLCGLCQPDETCQSGQCIGQACVPDCMGQGCGPDPVCGDSCGSCAAGQTCQAGFCGDDTCTPECSGLDCGPDPVCGRSCGTCPSDRVCDAGECVAPPCVPNCNVVQCGPDPVCGSDCGGCPPAHLCDAGACVEAPCEPDCSGVQCGPDPICGQSCGNCPGASNQYVGGQCVCQPNCQGRECGDDGCGDDCGPCNDHPASFCDDTGHCDCNADCSGRECGDDGCGGSCGQCTGSDVCSDGQCTGYCSGHGTLFTWGNDQVCACDPGYSPSSNAGLDCVPTSQVCTGGAINYDVDGDGANEDWFDPSDLECEMFELINYTRATHDTEGHDECHHPLMYNVEWSAHGRNHSMEMSDAGYLWHEDYPNGQNCAYGCDPACEMDMYMNGPDEPHCDPGVLSHHCNIMTCWFSSVGVGFWTPTGGTWNTQNFVQ